MDLERLVSGRFLMVSSQDVPEGTYEWYIEQAKDIMDAYLSGSITGSHAGRNMITLRRMIREQSILEARRGGFSPDVPPLYYKLEAVGNQLIGGYIWEEDNGR